MSLASQLEHQWLKKAPLVEEVNFSPVRPSMSQSTGAGLCGVHVHVD